MTEPCLVGKELTDPRARPNLAKARADVTVVLRSQLSTGCLHSVGASIDVVRESVRFLDPNKAAPPVRAGDR
jgi:hypothetical protein